MCYTIHYHIDGWRVWDNQRAVYLCKATSRSTCLAMIRRLESR
jgi:hypothetical protein